VGREETLKEKTAKGLLWGAVNSGATQVLSLIVGIFLARLLSPSDYGIVGMLAIFTAIAGNIQDSGFTAALINLKQPEDKDYNSVFWFNVIVSCCIYIILFFCAPLIAAFFRQPCLIELSRLLFLTFVVLALGTAQNAYLTKHLMNKEKAAIQLASLVVSMTVALVLAFKGYGYWSLAWQQLAQVIVLSIGRYYCCRWRPSRAIDFGPVRRMFAFSNKILFTTIVNTASNNMLAFIFGRLYQPHAVGVFTQANKWNNMGYSLVSGTLAQVAQPVLAAINTDDDRQVRVFRKMLRFTAFLSFPALLGLALVAEEFILITITDKWIESVVLLRILCISGAFFPLFTLYQNLIISRGRSDIYMWCTLAQTLLQLTVIVSLHRLGIQTMVTVYAAINIAWLLVWQRFAHRLIGIRLTDVLKDILPFMLAAAAVMAATYMATLPIRQAGVLLAARIVIAAAGYFALMKLFRVKLLDECIGYLRRRSK
jgi:O-antigen/teichoic acid export membrane protein